MFKLFQLKWKKELEELKSIHRIEMAEKDAALERLKKEHQSEFDIRINEATSLLKLQSEQKTKQLEIDYERKVTALRKEMSEDLLKVKEKVLQDGYEKLSVATQRLHEEGNITTKFVQDLAINMMNKAPSAKVKVLTGKAKDEV